MFLESQHLLDTFGWWIEVSWHLSIPPQSIENNIFKIWLDAIFIKLAVQVDFFFFNLFIKNDYYKIGKA